MAATDTACETAVTVEQVNELITSGLSEQQWLHLLHRSYDLDRPFQVTDSMHLPIIVIFRYLKSSHSHHVLKIRVGSHPSMTPAIIREIHHNKNVSMHVNTEYVAAWKNTPPDVLEHIFETRGTSSEPRDLKIRLKDNIIVSHLVENPNTPTKVLLLIAEYTSATRLRNNALLRLKETEYQGYPFEWVEQMVPSKVK